MKSMKWTLIAAAPLALLAGCVDQGSVLKVTDARVKLNPVENGPSAMYFTVHGGNKDTTLVEVLSEDVIRIEIHESGKDPKTGMMTMTPVNNVPIPAGGKVEFKPGGRHVMLWGMNRVPIQTGKLEVQFVFANGDRQLAEVPLQKAGEDAPAMTGAKMDHDKAAAGEKGGAGEKAGAHEKAEAGEQEKHGE